MVQLISIAVIGRFIIIILIMIINSETAIIIAEEVIIVCRREVLLLVLAVTVEIIGVLVELVVLVAVEATTGEPTTTMH